MDDATTLRLVTIVTLGVVLVVAVVGLTIVAATTDRDLVRAAAFGLAGVALLAALGGVSWWGVRRRRGWHVRIERDRDRDDEPEP